MSLKAGTLSFPRESSLFMASRTKSAFLQVHSIIGLAISLALVALALQKYVLVRPEKPS